MADCKHMRVNGCMCGAGSRAGKMLVVGVCIALPYAVGALEVRPQVASCRSPHSEAASNNTGLIVLRNNAACDKMIGCTSPSMPPWMMQFVILWHSSLEQLSNRTLR